MVGIVLTISLWLLCIHTNIMSANHYQKILLSKQDLAYLYLQFVAAANAKISHHLPASDSLDPLRIEVENIVNNHLGEAFEMAKLAFVVDGHDLGELAVSVHELLALRPSEEVVPFDTELNTRLRAVIQQVERETTEVTRLRRELPQQARDAYEALVSATDAEVTAMIKEMEKKTMEKGAEEGTERKTEEGMKEGMEKGMEEGTLGTLEGTSLEKGTSLETSVLPQTGTVDNAEELAGELLQSILRLHGVKTLLPAHQAQLDSLEQTVRFLEDNYERSR